MKSSEDFLESLLHDDHTASTLDVMRIGIEISKLAQMEDQTFFFKQIVAMISVMKTPTPRKRSRWDNFVGIFKP